MFIEAQKKLDVPQGTIRATVLIETITAAFEMEEILYELKEHAAGLNAGRWDYIFSMIKRFKSDHQMILPNRHQVTMAVPFMRSYTNLLVQACHRHGAHAIGGMSAFIPNRKDPEVTAKATEQVRADKQREASDGFDGSWVAHPDLVPVVLPVFDSVLGPQAHQKHIHRDDVKVSVSDLINTKIENSEITEQGVRTNIRVASIYIERWLNGLGAVAIDNLMEDAAAEISRAQLWQWLQNKVTLSDGRNFNKELYEKLRDEEVAKIGGLEYGSNKEAVKILDQLVLQDNFSEFLTLGAYSQI